MINPPTKNATTEVFVRFRDIQILNIDEHNSRITLKLAIVMFWHDSRILISGTSEDIKLINGLIVLPKEFVNLLWLPDAYIPDVYTINKYRFLREFEAFYYAV